MTLTANSGYLDIDSLVTYSATDEHDGTAAGTAGDAQSGGTEGMGLPNSTHNGSHVDTTPAQGNNANAYVILQSLLNVQNLTGTPL